MSDAIVERLRVLVPRCFELEQELARARGLDDGFAFDEAVKPGATAEQLAALEARLKRPLPPSYRAFLSLWNGASFGFGGGAAVLGTEDHHAPHLQQRLRDKQALFAELAAASPFVSEPIPFLVGDSRNMILFEPPVRDDGELDLVSYYLTTAEHRDRDVVAFFTRQIAELEAALPAKKRKSAPKRTRSPRSRK